MYAWFLSSKNPSCLLASYDSLVPTRSPPFPALQYQRSVPLNYTSVNDLMRKMVAVPSRELFAVRKESSSSLMTRDASFITGPDHRPRWRKFAGSQNSGHLRRYAIPYFHLQVYKLVKCNSVVASVLEICCKLYFVRLHMRFHSWELLNSA